MAETFKVAHLRVQTVDIVIVFVNARVGNMTPSEQQGVANALQVCATSAGLAGNIVMVWRDPTGRMAFWAPNNQQAYFREVTFEYLAENINKTLTCEF